MNSDTLVSTTLSIIPQSVVIHHQKDTLSSDNYTIKNNLIIWENRPAVDSITIAYRTFSVNFEAVHTELDTNILAASQKEEEIVIGIGANTLAEDYQDALGLKGLKYTGSFARGISFGNSQDLVLNSSFNMQVEGDIGGGVLLKAAISDENIPLQPEGNTQQLREFDKIYIQVSKDQHSLLAGDYEIKSPASSYFLQYFKKLQGATVKSSYTTPKGLKWSGDFSGAISKGKYNRQTITPIEGNQGPYKLFGAENETFIIVLAGTEQVTIDGITKKRGREHDYTIDYNSGTLTFTEKELITQDKRIIVEFEYATQDYTRSIFAVNNELTYKNTTLNLWVYAEQDGKTPTSNNELSDDQLNFLADIGDNTDQAFFSGVTPEDEYESQQIYYHYIDTIVNSTTYKILAHTTNSNDTILKVRFSEVGYGNGNYILSSSGINGRTYQWIAPDPITGIPQGNFEPIILLVTPTLQQLFGLKVSQKISEKMSIHNEFMLSRFDKNRFSTLDQGDNLGFANQMQLKNEFALTEQQKITQAISYEFKQANYVGLNNYRSAEFARDWNLNDATSDKSEHYLKSQHAWSKSKLGTIGYQLDLLNIDSLFDGLRHAINTKLAFKSLHLDSETSLLNSTSLTERTTFVRPDIHLYKTFDSIPGLQIGAKYLGEQNARTAINTDSLTPASLRFNQFEGYIRKKLTDKFGIETGFKKRYNETTTLGNWIDNDESQDIYLKGTYKQRAQNFTWTATHRTLQYTNPTLTTAKEDTKTFIGRVQHQANIKKGFIRVNTSYEINSGQEQILDFDYIEVPIGQGTHLWSDRNGDDVQQKDEFEIAPAILTDSAQYIRLSSYTNEFVRTNNIGWNQSLNINFKRLEKGDKPFSKLLGRFSNRSAIQFNRKTKDDSNVDVWNPFQTNISDTTLVFLNNSIRSTMYFNKLSPKYGIDFGYSAQANRNLTSSGFEANKTAQYTNNYRINFSKKITTNTALKQKTTTSDSELFESRRYEVTGYEVSPSLTYNIQRHLRAKAGYDFITRQNNNTIDQAQQHGVYTEWTYSKIRKNNLRAKLSLINVDFKGDASTPVGFNILQGLQTGDNYLWNIDYNHFLSKNIILNIGYEGRKTGTTNVRHFGRMQLRATF